MNLSRFSLSSSTIFLLIPACTNDGCGSAEEGRAGMNHIFRVKVDVNLVLAKGPVRVDGVQQDGVIFRGEFWNVSPLAPSKSLEDEE